MRRPMAMGHPSASRMTRPAGPVSNQQRPFDIRPHERGPYQGHKNREINYNYAAYKQKVNGLSPRIMRRPMTMGHPCHNQVRRTAVPVPDRKTLLHQSPASSNFEVDRALKEMIIMKAKLSPIVPISGLDINKKELLFHHPKSTLSEMPLSKGSSTPSKYK
ncbi:uncharacterized protein LOC123318263 [Coccinella septempunctata]|uniref:uncharacterized protein LOC123318263 n=1 Tax=Coccinella septempunctata TaxID=41139 RepID=UPI001D061736|nr:uncharacterized protein LOC123318263 [Coccinella septempunctata]